MWRVLGVLFVVQLIFSAWPVLVRFALEAHSSAVLIALLRDVLASVILWVGVWFESGRPSLLSIVTFLVKSGESKPGESPSFPERNIFVLLGVCSSINSVGYVVALRYVTPFNSALLHPTIPVFAATLGALFGVERLTPRKAVGTAVCIAGSIVVVVSQADLSVNSSLVGNLLLVLQSFAMAALLVGQRFVPPKHTSLKTTAMYYTVGAFLSAPISLTVLWATNGYSTVSVTALAVIAFGAIFVIAFNYAALTWANKKSSPSVPATSMMLQPPLTFLLGYVIGDRPSAGGWEIGGGAVIIAGLILTTMPSSSSDGDSSLLGGHGPGLQESEYDEEEYYFSGGSADEKTSFVGDHGLGTVDGRSVYKSLPISVPALTKRSPSGSYFPSPRSASPISTRSDAESYQSLLGGAPRSSPPSSSSLITN